MNILVRAAVRLVESELFEQETWLMLVKLGKRKGFSFLADQQTHPRMFGLSSSKTLLPLLKEDEERVKILRNFARGAGLSPSDTIIRYSHQGFFEFATALPLSYTTTKRQHSGLGREYQSHVRWTGIPRCNCKKKCNPTTCPCSCRLVTCSRACHANRSKSKCCRTGWADSVHKSNPRVNDDSRITNLQATGEKHISLCEVLHSSLKSATTDEDLVLPRIDAFRHYVVESTTNLDSLPLTFDYLCGDRSTAAIYVRSNSKYCQTAWEKRQMSKCDFNISEVLQFLKSDEVRPDALAVYLVTLGAAVSPLPHQPYYRSLEAFELSAQVYKQLPNATVAVSVLYKTLHQAQWATSKILTPSRTFACIAMYESGSLDIGPETLEEVMAMSSGNSIYVAASLLCDPSEVPAPYEVRRVIGNVGGAGIAMLIPPKDPRVREPKLESWNVINHAAFNGATGDYFKNTTLHLSFTGYKIPISTGSHGGQDTIVFLLESLISVYDQGQWVADLDVLRSLSRALNQIERAPGQCMSSAPQHPKSAVPLFPLTAIDNWEEFLDKPESPGIVRASGNWTARLALTVLSLDRGDATYILKGLPCWRCIESTKGSQPVFRYAKNGDGRGALITMFIC